MSEKDINWWKPWGRNTDKIRAVKIFINYISISKVCVDKYFNGSKFCCIGFNENNKTILIKPMKAENEYTLGLKSTSNRTTYTINLTGFIRLNNLYHEGKDNVYDCIWNDDKKWLEVSLRPPKSQTIERGGFGPYGRAWREC